MDSKKRSVTYILPNIFTASSIFAGVVSIINSINGEFTTASWLIVLALIFDGLDGRVARLTNTCSRFFYTSMTFKFFEYGNFITVYFINTIN